MSKKRELNADEMNDEPNSRQQSLVGYTLEKVNMASDCAKRAKSNIDEIIWHKLDREETIRRVAMVASDLATVISELANAKLAGK